MYASCCCLVANTHPNMTLKHNIYFEEVSRQGVVDRNFSFSSHAETHPGSGREKCVGEEWCPSGLVWPHVGLAGTGHGIATLPGRLLFPCGPCGLLPTSSTSGPVLWALFPITPTPLIQCCLPRDGEAESQQRFCRKEWRGAQMQTQGSDANEENHALPLLFILFLGWRTLNTVDTPDVALTN